MLNYKLSCFFVLASFLLVISGLCSIDNSVFAGKKNTSSASGYHKYDEGSSDDDSKSNDDGNNKVKKVEVTNWDENPCCTETGQSTATRVSAEIGVFTKSTTEITYDIPDSKRLIIKTFTAEISGTPDDLGTSIYYRLAGTVDGSPVNGHFLTGHQNVLQISPTQTKIIAHVTTDIYYDDTGTTAGDVRFELRLGSDKPQGDSAIFQIITFTGELVDIP